MNWNWNGPGWNWNWNGTEFQNGTGTVNGTAKIVERFMPCILGGLEGRRSLALTLVSLIFVRTDVSINRA